MHICWSSFLHWQAADSPLSGLVSMLMAMRILADEGAASLYTWVAFACILQQMAIPLCRHTYLATLNKRLINPPPTHTHTHSYSCLFRLSHTHIHPCTPVHFHAAGSRQLVFVGLAGEPWGYMGSRRLLWDMHKASIDPPSAQGQDPASAYVAGLQLDDIDQVKFKGSELSHTHDLRVPFSGSLALESLLLIVVVVGHGRSTCKVHHTSIYLNFKAT